MSTVPKYYFLNREKPFHALIKYKKIALGQGMDFAYHILGFGFDFLVKNKNITAGLVRCLSCWGLFFSGVGLLFTLHSFNFVMLIAVPV